LSLFYIFSATETEDQGGKGKSVPLQAWSGTEGSRKLRFPDFMTTAQDGGKVRIRERMPKFNLNMDVLNLSLVLAW